MSSNPSRSGAFRTFATRRPAAGALALLLCAGCGVQAGRGAPAAPAPGTTHVQMHALGRDTAPAATPPLTPFLAGARATVGRFGAFQVLEDRDTTSLQIPDVPSGWTKVHLSFTSNDGRVNVALTDNGSSLTVRSRTSTSCSSYSGYFHYGERAGESHLYEAMADELRRVTEACPRGMEAAEQYRRQFRHAWKEFPAAMNAMKTRILVVFEGRMARCENPANGYDYVVRMEMARRCDYE